MISEHIYPTTSNNLKLHKKARISTGLFYAQQMINYYFQTIQCINQNIFISFTFSITNIASSISI